MKFSFAVFLFALVLLPVLGEETKVFKHTKTKFSVRYPAIWTLAPEKEGTPFTVTAPDGAANVQVMTDVIKGGMTACEYLAKTEKSAEGERVNLIPDSRRRATAEQLKFMGVKEGCLGAYKIVIGKTEVLQGTGVYVAGKKVWVLIQTLHAEMRERHAGSVGEIAKSFTTK